MNKALNILTLLSIFSLCMAFPAFAAETPITIFIDDGTPEATAPADSWDCCCKVNGQCTGRFPNSTSDVSGQACDQGGGVGTWDCTKNPTAAVEVEPFEAFLY